MGLYRALLERVRFNSCSHGKPLQGRARHTHRKERGKEGGMGLRNATDLSCPGPLVPAHSDAGEVYGRHCQWHGVFEYQEIHTSGPGRQELHVSVESSRDTLNPIGSSFPPSQDERGG